MKFTRNKHTTPTYTWADMSWVKASSSSENEAVVARHASTDSPDTRANIRRRAGDATADKIAGGDPNAADTNQFAENQLAKNSRPVVARERTPGTTNKKAK